jgi:hypothetical protein
MDCHDLRFWNDVYRLCRELSERAQRGMKQNQPYWTTLESAAADVPVILCIACRTGNKKELREAILHAFSGILCMVRMLFRLSVGGHITREECREYMRRCVDIYDAMLVFIVECST